MATFGKRKTTKYCIASAPQSIVQGLKSPAKPKIGVASNYQRSVEQSTNPTLTPPRQLKQLTNYLFNFHGRIGRAKYWLGHIVIYFVIFFLYLLFFSPTFSVTTGARSFYSTGMIILAVPLFIAALVAILAIATKRLHDRDKDAWWLLLFYLFPMIAKAADYSAVGSAVSLWAFVELGCWPGTIGENRYGPSPGMETNNKSAGTMFALICAIVVTVLLLATGGYFWFSAHKEIAVTSGTSIVVEPNAPSETAPVVSPSTTGTPTEADTDEMTFHFNANMALRSFDLNYTSIDADGPITIGTADRFAAFLKDNAVPPGTTVYFNSEGGSVGEALQLGKMIRDHELDTSVGLSGRNSKENSGATPTGCFSACAFAFLGGVNRFVPSDSMFGVHSASTTAQMTPSQALQMGQSLVGDLVVYVTAMGVDPNFVYLITRAAPDNIILLSDDELHSLKVTTPAYKTDWEIESADGGFYLLATTETNHGIDKLALSCGEHGPVMLFLWNTMGTYMEDTLNYTTDYAFEFDNQHLDLTSDEVLQKVARVGNDYVSTVVALSPRIIDKLRDTKALTIEMMTPSHISYAGWTTDFSNGKRQFFDFLKSCDQVAD